MEGLTDSVVVQLGVGLAAAYLILKLVFEQIIPLFRPMVPGQKGKPGNGTAAMIKETHDRIADLHRWHDVRNSDGVFVWYVRSSLENALSKLADNIDTQTRVLQELVLLTKETARAMERMEGKQHE